MYNKMKDIRFSPKRVIPFGQEGIIFYLDFNNGNEPRSKYPPYTFILNITDNNFLKDPNGFGLLIEFDGIFERIWINNSSAPQLNISPNEKFTFFCRFKNITLKTSTIFARKSGGKDLSLDTTVSNIIITMEDNASGVYSQQIGNDNEWHEVFWGFDGTTWFIEFDGVRNENAINTHAGFSNTGNWAIGYDRSISSNYANVQITEIGLIKGVSL
jgi:hypothetical protein